MIGLFALMMIAALFFVPVMLFSVWTGAWMGLWALFWSAWFVWPAALFGLFAVGWLMLFGLPHVHLVPHFHALPTLLMAAVALAVGIWLARRHPRYNASPERPQ